jgi:hypothetical protein
MCRFSIKKKRTICYFKVGICCFALDKHGDGGEEVASYVILEFFPSYCYGIIQVMMFEEVIFVFVKYLDL